MAPERPNTAAGTRETYLVSKMGAIPESTRASAPNYGFGTGDRSGSMVLQSSTAKRAVGLSPGPIYLPSPRGVIGSGPKAPFSKSDAREASIRRAGALPGPGEYEKPSLIGGEHSSSHWRTEPRDGWGTSGRETAPIGSSPRAACGEFYELSSSMEQQILSTKSSKPNYAFSRSPRFADQQAARQKAAAPGPGAYRALSSGGMQVDSTLPSRPMYGFSRANRFRRSALDPKPELNSGKLPPTAVGKQVLSDLRTAPQCGFGKSSRFRPASAVSTPGPGSYNT